MTKMTTFTHVGVSTLKDEIKARFCNDALRVKVLEKNGHTDVDLLTLPNAMTKQEAVAYLLAIDFAAGRNGVQAALEAEVDKRTEKPKKARAPKAAALTDAEVEAAAATAELVANGVPEDAAF